jgi:hypothetical protein
MDSRLPFFDWLHLFAASAACTCERLSSSQHAAEHGIPSAVQSDRPEQPKQARRVRLIPCTPALHVVGE